MSKRMKLLFWLNHELCKTPEGEVMPKPLQWLAKAMFPITTYMNRQNHIRYDCMRNLYCIGGMSITPAMIAWLGDEANEGKIFRLVRVDKGLRGDENLIITIQSPVLPKLNPETGKFEIYN